MMLAPPTVLAAGDTGIGVEGGARASWMQAPSVAGSLTTRHGFGSGVEGTLDITYARELSSKRTELGSSALMLRAGARYDLLHLLGATKPNVHVVIFGGLAAGVHDQGVAIAGDIGATMAPWKSEDVFATVRLGVSGTVNGHVVNAGQSTVLCFFPGIACSANDVFEAPHTQGWAEAIVGYRLPVGRHLFFAVGVGVVLAVTDVEIHPGCEAGTGVETVF